MELNAKLKEIFESIEGSVVQELDSEEDFKGLFRDVDVKSDRLGETVTEKMINYRKFCWVLAD